VLAELESIGEPIQETYQEALKLAKIKCGHITGISPKECF